MLQCVNVLPQVWTHKIMTGKEAISAHKFFEVSMERRTRGHGYKPYKKNELGSGGIDFYCRLLLGYPLFSSFPNLLIHISSIYLHLSQSPNHFGCPPLYLLQCVIYSRCD